MSFRFFFLCLFPVLLQTGSHLTRQVFALFEGQGCHGLFHFHGVTHQFKLALFCKFTHAFHGCTSPSERTEQPLITTFHLAQQNLVEQ